MNTVYRTGSWYALIGPRAVVALPPDADAALVGTLWERVAAEEVSFAEVVDALTAAGGGSFSAIPPFAAVVREGEHARIAVRGRVRARVTTADDEREITGAEVTTWSERFVPAVTGIEIRVEDGAEDPALPIVAGVVRAGAIAAGAAVRVPAPSVPEPVEGSEAPDEVAPLVPEPVEGPDGGSPLVPEPVEGSEVPDEVAPLVPEPVEGPEAPDEVAPLVPEPVEGPEAPDEVALGTTTTGATTQDPEPALHPAELADADDLGDLGDTVLSAPAAAETILPPADTIAEPVGGHTLDFRPSAAPAPAGHVTAADVDGDHDGATISLAQARAMRADLPLAPTVSDAAPAPAAPIPAPVSAVPGITLEPARPVSADPVAARVDGSGPRVRLSTGQVVSLDRTVVIGRRPRASRSSGSTLPHLVAVDSPQQDISRSHLEIRPEADAVVVLDLHTTNGSTLLRPGAEPVRLHPGEQTIVVTGDVIDLGDGVTVAFEELP
ncbi:FHA domain protein [Microbacterium azadirachtae]|uniref:FHA domain protein n=1 Tax=Microbacterium azadirachtae TaxID=582680 RepID=A0A0F0L0Q6_9MICO|nr:FHA domain-containing protein [Microbacterium azadirachtae]KJL26692.1 FHA domain protein [Microbacterium azadirachtae]